MTSGVRFGSPSAQMRLRPLLRESRGPLVAGLGIALLVHGVCTQWSRQAAQQKPFKPLTTRFVKRQPRLTKPLELKRRLRTRRRKIQRRMVVSRPSVGRKGMGFSLRADQLLGAVSVPRTELPRSPRLEGHFPQPTVVAQAVSGTPKAQSVVDMSLEMVDIEALDTGQYHAMVIQDPTDKRNIKGFFHLAIAYSVNAAHGSLGAHYYENPMALPNLIGAINEYTDIKTDIAAAFPFASSELFLTPWVYCPVSSYAGTPFVLTDEEANNLGKYMLTGGFFFADDSNPSVGANPDRIARAMIRDAFRGVQMEQGNDWNFEKLPQSHAVYHCYFDFEGPPPGGDNIAVSQFHRAGRGEAPYEYLEGIVIDGRTVVIYSLKSYGTIWHCAFTGREPYAPGIRQLQFGVNLIVFALTQEGSITNRVMDSVR